MARSSPVVRIAQEIGQRAAIPGHAPGVGEPVETVVSRGSRWRKRIRLRSPAAAGKGATSRDWCGIFEVDAEMVEHVAQPGPPRFRPATHSCSDRAPASPSAAADASRPAVCTEIGRRAGDCRGPRRCRCPIRRAAAEPWRSARSAPCEQVRPWRDGRLSAMLPLEGDRGAEQAGLRLGQQPHRRALHPRAVAALGGEAGLEGGALQQMGDAVGEAAGDRDAHRAVGERDVAGGGAEAADQDGERLSASGSAPSIAASQSVPGLGRDPSRRRRGSGRCRSGRARRPTRSTEARP